MVELKCQSFYDSEIFINVRYLIVKGKGYILLVILHIKQLGDPLLNNLLLFLTLSKQFRLY